MQPSDALKSLVERMPTPDAQGALTENDKQRTEETIAAIQRGGRGNVVGLVEMLLPPGGGNDYKAHHALHGVAVYVTGLDDAARADFARTLAAELGGPRDKAVQEYLVRELQVAGGPEVVAALGKALSDEALCEPAAAALVSIGRGAAEQFRAALPNAPQPCRLTIVQGLAVLADPGALAALREAAGADDPAVRLAALAGLARLADPGSVDVLLGAADTLKGWQRNDATDACLTAAENLAAAGQEDAAGKILTHIQQTRTAPADQHFRAAAAGALAAMKG